MNTPIVVMSFNRPDLLARVLDSLLAQQEVDVRKRPVHLFQDGAVNRYSLLRYAQDEDIASCILVFKQKFPWGEVHASKENIGVCENFKRAEEFVFEQLGAECAYFFEDDLELSPAYVSMMDALMDWALSTEKVAYFAAYGDYYATEEERYVNARELTLLDHHWGFGLVARHWKAMQPLMQGFYDIIVGTDYQRRDHNAVFDLYRDKDFAPRATSQDSAKAVACARLGFARCNTVTSFAKYIGSSGLHMTVEAYDSMGYASVVVKLSRTHNLRLPNPTALAEFARTNLQMYRGIRASEYDAIRQNFPCREHNPARKCTRVDVVDAYRYLLCREPESEAVILARVNHHTVVDFVRGVISSPEFSAMGDRSSGQVSSSENLMRAYQLLLHRDPDEASMRARILGGYDIHQVVIAIIEGEEYRALLSKASLN